MARQMEFDNQPLSTSNMPGVGVKPIKRVSRDRFSSGMVGAPVTRALPAVSISVLPVTATLAALETQQLTATLLDSHGDPTTGEVIWESDDPTKATVDSSGLVTAVATGSATITGTAGQYSDTCVVTVS